MAFAIADGGGDRRPDHRGGLRLRVEVRTAGAGAAARRDALPSGVPSTDGKDLQGPVTQVTFSLDLDSFPSFSPDGTMLAYASLQQSKLDLFVRSFAPGSQTRQVTNDGQQNVQPDWSPDGQYLAYHSIARGGIWVVPATGGIDASDRRVRIGAALVARRTLDRLSELGSPRPRRARPPSRPRRSGSPRFPAASGVR